MSQLPGDCVGLVAMSQSVLSVGSTCEPGQASQPASSVNTQGGPQVQPASHDNIMTPLTFTLHTTTNTITSPLSSLSPN